MADPITLREVQEQPDRQDLFGILGAYLQPCSRTSAFSAASAFAALPRTTLDEEFLWGLWKDVIRVAEQLPHDHPAQDKLVLFLRELTLLPDTGVLVWDLPIWSSLPILPAALREHLDKPARDDSASWISFHAFAARLSHAAVLPSPDGGQTTAIWMLRAALEEEQQIEQKEKPGDKSRGLSAPAARDLATAAVHILYAGPHLAHLLAARPEPALDEAAKRMLKAGPLLRASSGGTGGGGAGLVRERWEFWAVRFRELAGEGKSAEEGEGEESAESAEARRLAARAARLMEVWTQNLLRKRG
ncbi:hypothetical protein F4775DRAFT_579296 [Biscogniauxia sp. FL1348]|nr:hypothetical protein F4775DRAFT_579296 [Biscogniauxia sp. FL1348]